MLSNRELVTIILFVYNVFMFQTKPVHAQGQRVREKINQNKESIIDTQSNETVLPELPSAKKKGTGHFLYERTKEGLDTSIVPENNTNIPENNINKDQEFVSTFSEILKLVDAATAQKLKDRAILQNRLKQRIQLYLDKPKSEGIYLKPADLQISYKGTTSPLFFFSFQQFLIIVLTVVILLGVDRFLTNNFENYNTKKKNTFLLLKTSVNNLNNSLKKL